MSEELKAGHWCSVCGNVFESITNTKKHMISKHYDYVLAQCNGDKKLMIKFVEN